MFYYSFVFNVLIINVIEVGLFLLPSPIIYYVIC